MIVLAIDTALSACQAALVQGDAVLAQRSEPMERGHQERIAPMTAELFAEAGLPPHAVDQVAVTIGPGSFTGLRVGIAFAKGLALGLDKPLVGIGTLQALAAGARGSAAAVIAAPHDRFYVQTFLDGAARSEPGLLEKEAAHEALMAADLVIGPASATFTGNGVERMWPNLADLARLAATAPASNEVLRPLYLREPDAKTIAERAAARAVPAS